MTLRCTNMQQQRVGQVADGEINEIRSFTSSQYYGATMIGSKKKKTLTKVVHAGEPHAGWSTSWRAHA